MSGIVTQNALGNSGLVKAAEAGGGAWTLIKSVTASADGNLSFIHGTDDVVLDSTYPVYLFKFINLHGSSDGSEFTVNFRDGGSAFDATKTTTSFYYYHAEDDSAASGSYKTDGDIAQGTGYQRLMDGSVSGADADQSLSGEMYLFSPSSTVFVKHFFAKTNSAMSWDASGFYAVGGYCNVTAAIDGVDFKFASGNIDLGKIKLFGLKDS